MVADGIERLGAQVQRGENDIGAVDGVVIAALEERRERRFGRMARRPVPAVVAGGRRRGQCDVQPHRAGDAHRNLGDLDGVSQPGAEVIVVGRDEHLALAGEAPERLRMVDAVEVALEARAEPIGLLGLGSVAGPARPGGSGSEDRLLVDLPRLTRTGHMAGLADPRGRVCDANDTKVGTARWQTVLLPLRPGY